MDTDIQEGLEYRYPGSVWIQISGQLLDIEYRYPGGGWIQISKKGLNTDIQVWV